MNIMVAINWKKKTPNIAMRYMPRRCTDFLSLKESKLQTRRRRPSARKTQVKVFALVLMKRKMSAPSMPKEDRNMQKFNITKHM